MWSCRRLGKREGYSGQSCDAIGAMWRLCKLDELLTVHQDDDGAKGALNEI
jgi:hypothetical protein